jgi:uncharacterized protein YecE (DUF72 family)
VLHIGTSGWSYPTWRGGFYPEGTRPEEFLAFYAGRFDTVELNTTGYRLPGEEQFRKWAAQVPDGFTFAPKLPFARVGPGRLAAFLETVSLLGDRLGPVRVEIQQQRDEGMLALLVGSVAPELRLALDFRHESWTGVELPPHVAVVNDLEHESVFRYVRLREPPYSEPDLRRLADDVRGGPETFVYFRHEDEPTAPAYAQTLLSLAST